MALSGRAKALPLQSSDRPEDVGLSADRLKRIRPAFQSDIDRGRLPGAIILIARRGRLAYLEAVGFQDRENQVPMKADAIFRIASLTKPVTSVAAMMLAEEGKIRLTAPVSIYLPEFKGLQVGVETMNSATGKTELMLEPARREMTIHDLLRHTSGLCYGGGNTLVDQAYRDADVFSPQHTLAQFVGKVAKLPLAHQPGTTFAYSVSTDVLGRVIEVVSDLSLDEFVSRNITMPLGMDDTGFFAQGAQVARVAEPQIEAETGKRPSMRDVVNRPSWMSGGGGMISTAPDYARFCQMLLNGGELDGARLLSPRPWLT
jgi:CubicO group peptidase (beta-lactamase class C family)